MTDSKKEQELEEILRKGEKEVAKNVKEFLIEQALLLVPFPKIKVSTFGRYSCKIYNPSYDYERETMELTPDNNRCSHEVIKGMELEVSYPKADCLIFTPKEGSICIAKKAFIGYGYAAPNLVYTSDSLFGKRPEIYTEFPKIYDKIKNSEYHIYAKYALRRMEEEKKIIDEGKKWKKKKNSK